MALNLDPSVIFSKDNQVQKQIDYDSDIDLYNNTETYDLYEYTDVDEELYSNTSEYNLEVANDDVNSLFSEPVLYDETDTSSSQVVNGLLMIVIIIQVIFISYLIYSFMFKKRSKNARN